MIDPTTIPRRLRRAIKPAVYTYRGLTAGLRLLPDFLIIGAQRAGTTYLYNNLAAHPCVAPALTKEVHFFDVWFARGLGWYRSFFALQVQRRIWQARGRPLLVGEASPYYLFHPHAPRRAAATLPHAKLIVLLRNPVDRAYSQYQHSRRRGAEHLAFAQALAQEEARLAGEEVRLLADEQYISDNHQNFSYQARGLYAGQIARWLNYFPREQLLVIQSELLYADPVQQLARVFAFLELPRWQPRLLRPDSPPYITMAPETRRTLRAFFAPHNAQLYALLETQFDWDEKE